MMPGVAAAGKPMPVLTLTPDYFDCDGLGNDLVGYDATWTGVNGRWVHLWYRVTTYFTDGSEPRVSAATVDRRNDGGPASLIGSYLVETQPHSMVEVSAQLVTRNGTPVTTMEMAGPIACP